MDYKKAILAVSLGVCTAVLSSSTFAQQPQPPQQQNAPRQCLIVRSAEGHRFRNMMVAGVLTGGIGLAAGGIMGGAKYEYVDAMNVPKFKVKYKGSELQKMQSEGVHVIVINKKAQSDETASARQSCKDFVQGIQSVPQPAAAPAAVPATSAPKDGAAPAEQKGKD
jgi:hypothetical protein